MQQEKLKNVLIRVKNQCDKLQLKISSSLLKKSIKDIPQRSRELEMLFNVVKEEIRSNLFLYVPSHRAKYYKQNLSNELTTPFPDASRELIKAGNCYATGEYTACVFHSMRATEIGLRSLAKYIDISFPYPLEFAEWQKIRS